MISMASFGSTLRQLRQKAGMSQRELASRVSLDFSYISKVENDRLPPPAADTIIAIARALGVEPDNLLTLVGKLPTGIQKLVGTNRAAFAFLLEAQRLDLPEDTWRNLAHSLQETGRMHRILLTEALSSQALQRLRSATDASFDILDAPTEEELLARIADYDALIIRGGLPVTAAMLATTTRLKVIGCAGINLDAIDLTSASLHGILVMNTPDANTITSAEHAFALLLALCRHIPQANARITAGDWPRDQFTGKQLHGKTLGLLGCGRTGKHVARLAQGFGLTVLAVDPYMNENVARDLQITLVSIDELLTRSDIISLHEAVTPETTGLINAAIIARMKPGVLLVNVVRGELIDETALIAALRSGQIGGAALDGSIQEPLPPDSPLRTLKNVVLTPRLAASTIEAQEDASIQAVQQVLDALRGADFKNAVNMPVADVRIFRQLRPYLLLAERLGNLQIQLAARPITQVEIEMRGDDIADQSNIVTIAVLKGILDAMTDTPVNYINALHLALERGIRVTESRGQTASNYANQISCRVSWKGGQRLVVGSLLGREAPRVVQINEFPLDANLEGIILVIENVDMPGVISRVSTLLAANSLNIAEWRLGRRAPGAQALSFVNLDTPASQAILEQVKNLEGVISVTQVYL